MKYEIHPDDSTVNVVADIKQHPSEEDINTKVRDGIREGFKLYPQHRGKLVIQLINVDFRSQYDHDNLIETLQNENILNEYYFGKNEFTTIALYINGLLYNEHIKGEIILRQKNMMSFN